MMMSELVCVLSATSLIMISLSLMVVSLMTAKPRIIIVNLFAFAVDLLLFQGVYDAYTPEATRSILGGAIKGLRPEFRVALFLALLVIALMRAYTFQNVRRKNLTPFSMTEALDYLPTGIIFATENGQIFQTNELMEHLYYQLSGNALRKADNVWNAEGIPEENIYRLEEPRVYQTEDGRKWMFVQAPLETEFEGIREILAIDVTREEELLVEQQEAYEEQQRMNRLLTEYNVMVDDTIRKEELLVAKMRVHDSMGSDLIAAKMFLSAEEGPANADVILETWQRNNALLYEDIGTGVVEDVLKRFYDAAEHLGIKLKVTGRMPANFDAANLIGIGIQECMTNAIQHGQATEMYVKIEEWDTEFKVSYSNNGLNEDDGGHEGGGLTILRKSAEKLGATMERVKGERYCLRLHIPKLRV